MVNKEKLTQNDIQALMDQLRIDRISDFSGAPNASTREFDFMNDHFEVDITDGEWAIFSRAIETYAEQHFVASESYKALKPFVDKARKIQDQSELPAELEQEFPEQATVDIRKKTSDDVAAMRVAAKAAGIKVLTTKGPGRPSREISASLREVKRNWQSLTPTERDSFRRLV